MRRSEAISPVKVFLLVLAVVFAVELAIMVVLAAAAPKGMHAAVLSIFDSAILVAVLSPLLWLLVVRPLRALVVERGALLARALQAQEEERAKLARDLHDELGQVQTAILLGLGAIGRADTVEQAHRHAAELQEIAAGAVDATRRMARGLSPSVLADLGLGAAAERVCEDIAAASGIKVAADIRIGATRLDSAVEIAAYRVLQEALTNAAKHSGASAIRVALTEAGNRLTVAVQDNGLGMSEQGGNSHGLGSGLGMAGMRERVVLLNGDFAVSSGPDGGTYVMAAFPIDPTRA